ncbi:hypothetical protein HDU93_010070, partial [Gonapodya sp. JEL0774]
RFIRIMTAKISQTDMEGVDIKRTPWWRWISGFLREVGRKFGPEIRTFAKTLEYTVFVDGEVDSRILEVWSELRVFYEARVI